MTGPTLLINREFCFFIVQLGAFVLGVWVGIDEQLYSTVRQKKPKALFLSVIVRADVCFPALGRNAIRHQIDKHLLTHTFDELVLASLHKPLSVVVHVGGDGVEVLWAA